jgi:hypothetical protein
MKTVLTCFLVGIVFVLLSAAVVEVDEDVSWGHKKALLK